MRSIITLCLPVVATIFSQSAAAQSAIGEDATDDGSVEVLGNLDPAFTDGNGKIVAAFASTKGIGEAEAAKQLRAMVEARRLIPQFEEEFGDDFAGMIFKHGGGSLEINVRKLNASPQDQEKVQTILDTTGIQYEGAVVQSVLSELTGGQLFQRLRSVLSGIDRNADFSIDLGTGDVTIYSDLPIISRTLLAFIPGDINVEKGADLILTTNLIAGSAWNGRRSRPSRLTSCTMGFKALHPDGRTGAITAGHCDDNSPAEFNPYANRDYGDAGGNRLSYSAGDEWTSNGLDVQFHTLGESDDTILAYYWDGNQSKKLTGMASTAPPEGDYFCWYGRATGWNCGYSGKPRYSSAYGGYFQRILSNGRGDLLSEGDSGGPVVQGSIGWGILHAYEESSGDALFNDLAAMRSKIGFKFYSYPP